MFLDRLDLNEGRRAHFIADLERSLNRAEKLTVLLRVFLLARSIGLDTEPRVM